MFKRIGIDIDDTVADYMGGAIPMMEKLYGLKPIPDIKGEFSKETRWQALGFPIRTREEVKQLRKDMYIKGRLFRDLPLLEHYVAELTLHLTNLGFKIYFITARDPAPEIVEDTHYWLDKHAFIYNDVFFTDEKIKLCELMRIPILVDDDPGNAREAVASGMKFILRDTPFNRHLDNEMDPKDLNRVDNWQDIVRVAEELTR